MIANYILKTTLKKLGFLNFVIYVLVKKKMQIFSKYLKYNTNLVLFLLKNTFKIFNQIIFIIINNRF